MDLLVHRQFPSIIHQSLQARENDIPGCSRFKAFGVVQAEQTPGMAVVVEPARNRLAHARLRHLFAEYGIDEGGLTHPRLTEDCKVEGA